MTKEEWKKIEKALSGIFGMVELFVDGHRISFHKKQIGKNRLGIMTYVDGRYRGKWEKDDPETRYLRCVVKAVWKKSEIERIKKLYGKRDYKNVKAIYEKTYTYCDPFWFSVGGIRRHYERTFKDIKLVAINGKAVEEKTLRGLLAESVDNI